MKDNKRTVIILICIIFLFIIDSNLGNEPRKLEIDAISSVSMNDQEKLLIVANCNRIEDRTKFAKEVLQKYMDNSFQSIRLSTDLRESVTCLQVSVYLQEEQIENGNPVMGIEYRLQRASLNNDIRENSEQMDIFIDGEKMDV